MSIPSRHDVEYRDYRDYLDDDIDDRSLNSPSRLVRLDQDTAHPPHNASLPISEGSQSFLRTSKSTVANAGSTSAVVAVHTFFQSSSIFVLFLSGIPRRLGVSSKISRARSSPRTRRRTWGVWGVSARAPRTRSEPLSVYWSNPRPRVGRPLRASSRITRARPREPRLSPVRDPCLRDRRNTRRPPTL